MLEKARRVQGRFLNPAPTEIGGFGLIRKVLPLYLANREERTPRRPLGPFRTDPRAYAEPPAGGLRVTWFGHSSALIEIDGARVLVDPVWDERASPVRWAGPRRFFAPTLALSELPRLDAVLISHDHYDHLGAGTVRSLARLQPGARWVTALGVGDELRTMGVPAGAITELDWTDSFSVADVRFACLPARHFSGRLFRRRFGTLWASWALGGPRHRVFYGADSGEWDGFSAVGREYGAFDLTMLEIGAYNDLWRDIHMGPEGALRTHAQLGGGLLMPIHWGLFDLALHAWRDPIERVWREPGVRLWSPAPGRPTEVDGGEVREGWWR